MECGSNFKTNFTLLEGLREDFVSISDPSDQK